MRLGDVAAEAAPTRKWEKMVRPEGFEPPTNGFGSHYSIRLSYERMLQERDCSRMARSGLA
jgi:hypothetical protein